MALSIVLFRFRVICFARGVHSVVKYVAKTSWRNCRIMNPQTHNVAVIFGTRPEAIKLAPLILALRERDDMRCTVCVTGQHRQMLDQVLEVFGIHPDIDFDLMAPNQSLGQLTSGLVSKIDGLFQTTRPDFVLVQGDTTSVFAAALTAFYHHIPVGHVEAGLRTGNLQAPWPEEANRVLTTRLADIHFAPTETAKSNLLKEGVRPDSIHVTGNTVIDSLLYAAARTEVNPPFIEGITGTPNETWFLGFARMVLITGHRRENFGEGFRQICQAIVALSQMHPAVHFVYPVHLNPNVQQPVREIIGEAISNVHLIPPQPYLAFVSLMKRAHLILTDSGGVQEEAPSLGKPVLVMRSTTERPEAVAAGTSRLVGTDEREIIQGVHRLLTNEGDYQAMSKAVNPYGDGKASVRILDALCDWFGTQRRN